MPLTIVRQGQSLTIELPLVRERRLMLARPRGIYPSYLVYGPLVFSPASPELINAIQNHLKEGGPALSRWWDRLAFDDEELVVVTSILPHPIIEGYRDPSGQVVREVNGRHIRNLRHLVETLNMITDQYVEFEFYERHAETLVFDRKEVLAAMEEILSKNNIRHACSADMARGLETSEMSANSTA